MRLWKRAREAMVTAHKGVFFSHFVLTVVAAAIAVFVVVGEK